MIFTYDRSYDVANTIGSEYVEVLDDLKIHINSKEAKPWWGGERLKVEVSVTAPDLHNYDALHESFTLPSLALVPRPFPFMSTMVAYNTRKNKRKLMEVARDLSGKACSQLFSKMPEKYNDESKLMDYTSKLYARLEEELIGIVEDNEPDGGIGV